MQNSAGLGYASPDDILLCACCGEGTLHGNKISLLSSKGECIPLLHLNTGRFAFNLAQMDHCILSTITATMNYQAQTYQLISDVECIVTSIFEI